MNTCYLNYRADHNTHTIVPGENPFRSVPTLTMDQVNAVLGPVPGDVINVRSQTDYDIAPRRSLLDYQYDSAETAIAAHAAILGDSKLIRNE